MSETIQDDALGNLTYDTEFQAFRGRTQFDNKQVEIWVYFDSLPDQVSEAEIAKAREALGVLVARKVHIEDEIVREYLDLYNTTWRDGEIISRDQFLAILEAESIDIEYGRVRALWYVAGDLFTDHSIHVRFKDDGSISKIALDG